MSFGYSIGDFIATGELAYKIYKDVYLIAKGAPREIEMLQKELSILSNSIRLLVEEASNPNSILNSTGGSRVDMINEIMAQAKATLLQLEVYAKKHNIVQDSTRPRLRRAFDKFAYSRDASKITALRSKIEYHYGTMNLLLTSLTNSSVERLTTEHRVTARNVESISQLLPKALTLSTVLPQVSSIDDKQTRSAISDIFMEQAEIKLSWLAIGIGNWLQASRWWSLKAQASLNESRTNGTIDSADTKHIETQAYMDLLKAAWILVDIVPLHPQRLHQRSSQQQQRIKSLAEMVVETLTKIHIEGKILPTVQDLATADARIWNLEDLTLMDSNRMLQQMHQPAVNGISIFKGFGTYHASPSTDIEVDFALIYQPIEDAVYLVGHTTLGIELIHIDAATMEKVYFDGSKMLHITQSGIYKLSFNQKRKAIELFYMLRGLLSFLPRHKRGTTWNDLADRSHCFLSRIENHRVKSALSMNALFSALLLSWAVYGAQRGSSIEDLREENWNQENRWNRFALRHMELVIGCYSPETPRALILGSAKKLTDDNNNAWDNVLKNALDQSNRALNGLNIISDEGRNTAKNSVYDFMDAARGICETIQKTARALGIGVARNTNKTPEPDCETSLPHYKGLRSVIDYVLKTVNLGGSMYSDSVEDFSIAWRKPMSQSDILTASTLILQHFQMPLGLDFLLSGLRLDDLGDVLLPLIRTGMCEYIPELVDSLKGPELLAVFLRARFARWTSHRSPDPAYVKTSHSSRLQALDAILSKLPLGICRRALFYRFKGFLDTNIDEDTVTIWRKHRLCDISATSVGNLFSWNWVKYPHQSRKCKICYYTRQTTSFDETVRMIEKEMRKPLSPSWEQEWGFCLDEKGVLRDYDEDSLVFQYLPFDSSFVRLEPDEEPHGPWTIEDFGPRHQLKPDFDSWSIEAQEYELFDSPDGPYLPYDEHGRGIVVEWDKARGKYKHIFPDDPDWKNPLIKGEDEHRSVRYFRPKTSRHQTEVETPTGVPHGICENSESKESELPEGLGIVGGI